MSSLLGYLICLVYYDEFIAMINEVSRYIRAKNKKWKEGTFLPYLGFNLLYDCECRLCCDSVLENLNNFLNICRKDYSLLFCNRFPHLCSNLIDACVQLVFGRIYVSFLQ